MTYRCYSVHGLTLLASESLDDCFYQGDGWTITDAAGKELYERRSFDYRDNRWYPIGSDKWVWPRCPPTKQ